MAMPVQKARYTFADLLTWDERREDVAKVNVLDGFFIELNKVFSE